MKLSCCENTYMGIPQRSFERMISMRILVEGDHIPCMHCASLYVIENYQLVFLTRLSREVFIAVMKKLAIELYDNTTKRLEGEKGLDAELNSIYEEFKDIKL